MAEALRRSNREIKKKKDSDFLYDEIVLNAIIGNNINSSDIRQQRPNFSLGTSLPNVASETSEVNFSARPLTESSEFELFNNSNETVGVTINNLRVNREVPIDENQAIDNFRHLFTSAASSRASVINVIAALGSLPLGSSSPAAAVILWDQGWHGGPAT